MKTWELDMSETINQQIAQLSNLILGLSECVARTDPNLAKVFIGRAVLASRKQGAGDHIALQVYQKVFPGQELPIEVSSDIMETIVNKPKS